MDVTYSKEIHHLSFGGASPSLTAYVIDDGEGHIIERGCVALWPCWDDRRGICIVRGHIIAYNQGGEVGQSFRAEYGAEREQWDSEHEAKMAIDVRTRWHWTYRHEEAARVDPQDVQEPAQEPS